MTTNQVSEQRTDSPWLRRSLKSKTSWTYLSRADANKDREQQRSLVSALDTSPRSLYLDECGAWFIHAKTGKVYTWGDGKTWVLYVACSSPRQWSGLKQKLSFMTVRGEASHGNTSLTQDCEEEGCLRMSELPNPKQARLIREALGLPKRRNLSEAVQEKRREALSLAK